MRLSAPSSAGYLLAVFVLGNMLPTREARAAEYGRLIEALRTDPSYKVRMKAIRVLGKRIANSGRSVPEVALVALGNAARLDESYLVRGMACATLGTLQDGRAKEPLQGAKGDPEAFVRALAEAALEKLDRLESSRSKAVLVVAVEPRPDVEVSEEMRSKLYAELRAELERRAMGHRIADESQDPGFLLTGTLSRLDALSVEGDKLRLTLEVKLSVATWPQRNLRHVLTARAGATVREAQDSPRIRMKLLRAALARAVADALNEIEGT